MLRRARAAACQQNKNASKKKNKKNKTCHVLLFCVCAGRRHKYFTAYILTKSVNDKTNSPVRAKSSPSTRSVAQNLQRTKGPGSKGIFVFFFFNHLTLKKKKRQGAEKKRGHAEALKVRRVSSTALIAFSQRPSRSFFNTYPLAVTWPSVSRSCVFVAQNNASQVW